MMEAGGPRQQAALRNIREDPCVPPPVADRFLNALGSLPPPANHVEAYNLALSLVADQDLGLTCSGNEVPEDMFTVLFRFESVDTLQLRVPDACAVIGLKRGEQVLSITDEDLATLTDEYSGPVKLGNRIGIVWVTDHEQVKPLLADLRQLADRLGLELDAALSRIIICVYARSGTPESLHVPRALDGLDQVLFRVNLDCSAPCGFTRLASDPNMWGLPEAVHRSCSVTPQTWSYRRI